MHRACQPAQVDGAREAVDEKVRLSCFMFTHHTSSLQNGSWPDPGGKKVSFRPLTSDRPPTIKGHTHVQHAGPPSLWTGSCQSGSPSPEAGTETANSAQVKNHSRQGDCRKCWVLPASSTFWSNRRTAVLASCANLLMLSWYSPKKESG